MPKLSAKDWWNVVKVWAFLLALLVAIYFSATGLKKFILGIPGLQDTWKNFIHQLREWIGPWIPHNIELYLYGLGALAVLYFFLDDLIQLLRGKRDVIEDKELELDDQLLRSIARDQGAPLPRPFSDASRSFRQFRYSAIVQYWVFGILLFGLMALWAMAIVYNQKDKLEIMTALLSSGCLYFLYLAIATPKIMRFDDEHFWMGKNENKLRRESDFRVAYYTHFLVRYWFSVEKQYGMLVLRRGFCFPPFHWFIDRFFPASNARRQVFFLSTWKDEEGVFVPSGALVKRALEHCDLHHVRVKRWTTEAQIFLIAILLASAFFVWIYLR